MYMSIYTYMYKQFRLLGIKGNRMEQKMEHDVKTKVVEAFRGIVTKIVIPESVCNYGIGYLVLTSR